LGEERRWRNEEEDCGSMSKFNDLDYSVIGGNIELGGIYTMVQATRDKSRRRRYGTFTQYELEPATTSLSHPRCCVVDVFVATEMREF
jgi:hypothetical protein